MNDDTGFFPRSGESAADCGILVVGHGTRDPIGAEETAAVTHLLSLRYDGIAVEGAFLELLEPSIATGLERLRDRGCRTVVVAPLLLFAAGHARHDVPDALAAAAAATATCLVQADVLGIHPALVALAAQRRAEAVAGRAAVAVADTVDVVVGRGASDGGAEARLAELIAAVDRQSGGPRARRTLTGFVAAARPTVAEALADAAAVGPRRVVVRPHLLFSGAVERDVAVAVAAARAAHPAIEWLLAPRLGADAAIAAALADRIAAVWPHRIDDTPARPA